MVDGEITPEQLAALTPAQLATLQRMIRERAGPAVLTDRICTLPEDRAKDILCSVARANQDAKSGWQKYVLSTIERRLRK